MRGEGEGRGGGKTSSWVRRGGSPISLGDLFDEGGC